MLTDEQLLAMAAQADTHVLDENCADPADGFYRMECKVIDREAGLMAMLTRDCGLAREELPHPLLDRMLHLSLSFFDPETRAPRPFNREAAHDIVGRLWGVRALWMVWTREAVSLDGRYRKMRHFALFCGAEWKPLQSFGDRAGAAAAVLAENGFLPALPWFEGRFDHLEPEEVDRG